MKSAEENAEFGPISHDARRKAGGHRDRFPSGPEEPWPHWHHPAGHTRQQLDTSVLDLLSPPYPTASLNATLRPSPPRFRPYRYFIFIYFLDNCVCNEHKNQN